MHLRPKAVAWVKCYAEANCTACAVQMHAVLLWIGLKRGRKFIHSHVAGIGFWIHDRYRGMQTPSRKAGKDMHQWMKHELGQCWSPARCCTDDQEASRFAVVCRCNCPLGALGRPPCCACHVIRRVKTVVPDQHSDRCTPLGWAIAPETKPCRSSRLPVKSISICTPSCSVLDTHGLSLARQRLMASQHSSVHLIQTGTLDVGSLW